MVAELDHLRLLYFGVLDTSLVLNRSQVAGEFRVFQDRLHSRLCSAEGGRYHTEWKDRTSGELQRRERVFERLRAGLGWNLSLIRFDWDSSLDLGRITTEGPVGEARMDSMWISFHEYGIGVVTGLVEVDLEAPITVDNAGVVLEDLTDAITCSRPLAGRINERDEQVGAEAGEVIAELGLPDPLLCYEDTAAVGVEERLLWGHSMVVLDCEPEEIMDREAYGRLADRLVAVGHRQGLINMWPSEAGFVHVGWGRSLAAGLGAEDLGRLQEVMRRLQFDWRAMDILNQLLCRQLDQHAAHRHPDEGRIREQMDWMERLDTEIKLYKAHRAECLHGLDPSPYAIYRETMDVWRMEEQVADCQEKVQALEALHSYGAKAIDSLREKRLNAVLGLIAVLTVVSVVVDAVGFIWPDFTARIPTPWRVLLLVGVPVLFLLLLVPYVLRAVKRKHD